MFDFEIHFVFVERVNVGIVSDNGVDQLQFLLAARGVQMDNDYSRKKYYTWGNNSLSWYDGDARGQLNEGGKSYCYIGI